MEALNGDVGRVAREVALETGYRRAPLASLQLAARVPYRPAASGLPALKIWTGSGTGKAARATQPPAAAAPLGGNGIIPADNSGVTPVGAQPGGYQAVDNSGVTSAGGGTEGFVQPDSTDPFGQNQAFDTNRQDFLNQDAMMWENEGSSQNTSPSSGATKIIHRDGRVEIVGKGDIVKTIDNRPYLNPKSRPSFLKKFCNRFLNKIWSESKDHIVRDANTGEEIH